jgi:hypothetical protein
MKELPVAYDAKDPDTIKAVKAAVDAAVLEAGEEHETAVTGLKGKNTELLGKLKAAREGKGLGDPAEVERLEGLLATSNDALKAANKSVTKLTGERDGFKTQAETEAAASKRLVIDGALTSELVKAGVKKEFMPAVQMLLAKNVEQTIDGDKRSATVAGKPLSEFVKTWSQSDEGKVYVTAPANGGANALGGKANGEQSGKIIPMADYEANPASYAADFKAGATLGPKLPA